MFLNRKRKNSRLLITACVLVCMLTACGSGGGKNSGSNSSSQSGQQTQQTQQNAQTKDSGTQESGSVLAEDSILNFQNDKDFARLQSDMRNGDIPLECNVLYDEDGARPDVTVTDQETIREIYGQLADMTVGEKSSEKVTGSYHHISFRLRNDTYVTFNFEGENLFCHGMDNYTVSGGKNLWNSVRRLQMAVMNSQDQAKQTAGTTAQADTAKTTSSSEKNTEKNSDKNSGSASTKDNAVAGKVSPDNQKEVEIASGQTQNPSISGIGAKSENELDGEAVDPSKEPASGQGSITGSGQKKTAPDKKPAEDLSGDKQKTEKTNPSDKPAVVPAEPAAPSDEAGETPAAVTPAPGAADPAERAGTADSTDSAKESETKKPAQTEPEQADPAANPADSTTGVTAENAENAETAATGTTAKAAETADPALNPAIEAAYTDIVRAYAKVFNIDKEKFMEDFSAGLYSREAPSPEMAPDYDERINYDLFLDLYTGTLEGEAAYGLHDYNGDGIQELVIAVVDGDYKTLRAMYTFDGKKAVSLFTGSLTPAYRVDVFALPNAEFLVHSSGGAASGGDTICRIAKNAAGMEIIAEYEYDATQNGNLDHISKTGEVLTEDEFYQKYSETKNPADGITFEKVSEDAAVKLPAAQ